MRKCLFIVDVQNGFISENTKHILEKINFLINAGIFDYIIVTKFINKEGSPYRQFLNWSKLSTEEEISLYKPVEEVANQIVIKYIYTGLSEEVLNFLTLNEIDKVFIAGIDTDCCVLATAIDLFEHNIRPFVLESYSASNGGVESHKAAIKVLERLIGNNSIIVGMLTKQQIDKIFEE